MSIESAKAFLNRIVKDEKLRNELSAAKSKEEHMTMVKSEGFEFTEEEFKTVKSELSDEQLEKVVGGTFNGYFPGPIIQDA